VKYNPRTYDDEVAFLVGGQWYDVLSAVENLDGEHRFITHHPRGSGLRMEMHVMGDHIQAILWNQDQ